MKKVIVFAAFLGIVALCSSCKKECTCTTTIMGLSTSTKVKLEDSTFKNCSDLENSMQVEAEITGATIKCK